MFNFAQTILNDVGIEKAIERGFIKIDKELLPNQIQPASLDVRIGEVRIFDNTVKTLTAKNWNARSLKEVIRDDDPTTKFAYNYPDKLDEVIDIPPSAYAEIFFHENIEYNPNEFFINFDLRSSRGRDSLFPMQTNFQKEDGRIYIPILNRNPNTLRLHGRSKIAQLFIHPNHSDIANDGYLVNDPNKVRDIANEISGGKLNTIGQFVVFNVGNYSLRFRENLGVINTREKISDDVLYIKSNIERKLVVMPGEAMIVELEPEIKVPADIGIQLLHKIPLSQEPGHLGINSNYNPFLETQRINAGWIDPGYEGKATAHPYVTKVPLIQEKGTPLALGIIYKLNTKSKRAYGSKKLGSHYQNTTEISAKN